MKNIKENWDEMAQAYEEFNTAEDSYCYNIEWPTIKTMLPDLSGKKIIDVGCGTGIFTFLLETCHPQKLVGIDLSDSMLDIAKKKAEKQTSQAAFIQGDATKTDEYVNERFDLVFSSTMTHYIKDLRRFFAGLAKCLADDGSIILSIIHPVYSAQYPIAHGDLFPEDDEWKVRYLDKSDRVYIQPWIEYNDSYENTLSRSYHHLFQDYVNAISEAGLFLQRIEEPLPPESWKDEMPGRYDAYMETPTYMILKIAKLHK